MTDEHADVALADYFAATRSVRVFGSTGRRRRAGWHRNHRGNYTRRMGDRILTVFRRPPGGDWWAWSIHDGERVRFSERGYANLGTAKHAVMSLMKEGV